MTKIFHIRDGLTPRSLKDIKDRWMGNERLTAAEKEKWVEKDLRSILSQFIKNAEEKATNQSKRSAKRHNAETLADDRRHVKDMLPFDGPADMAMKAAGDYGLFTAVYECYNNHWGLKTIPDDWWYTIIRTVAMAIDDHSKQEEVRKYFVNHEGKKRLEVYVDSMNHIDYKSFFNKMTNLIQSNIKVENYVDTIRSSFSTSTETHRISSEITIMSSMQEYFEYVCCTLCGIPFVELEGTADDWVKLKTKLGDLKKMLAPINSIIGLTEEWWVKVDVICDKLIETYHGDGDKEWWSKIFTKERGFGSGASAKYDGWFLRDLLHISGSISSFNRIPSGLVSVPLTFNDNGFEYPGAIVSGIAGIKIDETGKVPVVSSTHGWAIFK